MRLSYVSRRGRARKALPPKGVEVIVRVLSTHRQGIVFPTMRAGEGQHPVGKRDGVIHAASTLSAMDGIAPLQNQSTRQFLITVSALRKVRNGIGRQFLFR